MTDVQKIIICIIVALASTMTAKYIFSDKAQEAERAFLFNEQANKLA